MSQIYDLWCKRHLLFPKISMKIFLDRNFYNLPTNENFCILREFHKNRKKTKIPEIIYGMSSYRDEFLRLTMGRLSVVDGFETNSWPHRHSGCNFKKWWIFMIFDFLNCGFWHLSGRISADWCDFPRKYIETSFQTYGYAA